MKKKLIEIIQRAHGIEAVVCNGRPSIGPNVINIYLGPNCNPLLHELLSAVHGLIAVELLSPKNKGVTWKFQQNPGKGEIDSFWMFQCEGNDFFVELRSSAPADRDGSVLYFAHRFADGDLLPNPFVDSLFPLNPAMICG